MMMFLHLGAGGQGEDGGCGEAGEKECFHGIEVGSSAAALK